MSERTISEESTIYHYTLVRKIGIRPVFLSLHLLALGLFLGIEWISFGALTAPAALAGFAAAWLVHIIFTRLFIAFTKHFSSAAWSNRLALPWLGYLPSGTTAFSSYRLWLHQSTWIGAAAIVLLFQWLPGVWFSSLLFAHIWMILPRYSILWSFRKLGAGGLIRFNEKDISYYRP